MGYTPNRRLYRLKFEDDELAGLEVTARAGSVATYRRIAALANKPYSSPPSDEDLERIADLYAAFAGVLVGWNLEEPVGVPVPTTLHGIESQEPWLVNSVVTAWLEAVQEALMSEDTAEAVEATLPMEPLVTT